MASTALAQVPAAETRRTEHAGEQDAGGVAGDTSAQRRHVAAGDVSGLVRQHADHLVRRVRLLQRAGVDEHVAAVEHEGIEGVGAHDPDRDALLAEPGDLEDRMGVVVEQLLDLGIADEALGAGRHGGAGQCRYASEK